MSLFKTAAMAALMTAIPLTAVQAADPITIPVATEAEVPVFDEAGFDWTGFYAGVYGQGTWSSAHGTEYGVGVALGANYAFEYFLLGGEVAFHSLDTDSSYFQALGKAGVVVTDNLLLYAAGGYGVDAGPPDEDHALLGAGVELAVTDNLSVRAQYLHGFPITGGNAMDQVSIGANFHF